MPANRASHNSGKTRVRGDGGRNFGLLSGTPTPPQHKTGNAQQCRRRKGLMRPTRRAVSHRRELRCALVAQLLRNSGKTRGGRDGGRNFGTWASFREPTTNL